LFEQAKEQAERPLTERVFEILDADRALAWHTLEVFFRVHGFDEHSSHLFSVIATGTQLWELEREVREALVQLEHDGRVVRWERHRTTWWATKEER
jgi:hypothetical protein